MKTEQLQTTDLVVRVWVVGNSKYGDDVVFAKHADQRGYWWVILFGILCVFALWVQVALLVVAWHDAGQYVSAICLVVEGWLGGENQEMRAVVSPTNPILKEEYK